MTILCGMHIVQAYLYTYEFNFIFVLIYNNEILHLKIHNCYIVRKFVTRLARDTGS